MVVLNNKIAHQRFRQTVGTDFKGRSHSAGCVPAFVVLVNIGLTLMEEGPAKIEVGDTPPKLSSRAFLLFSFMTYDEQLQDERWLLKRDQILQRDWRVCQVCLSGKDLNVHHKKYIEGRLAWEYADYYLITLCQKCHKNVHQEGKTPVLKTGDPIIDGFAKIKESIQSIYGLMRYRG